MRHLRLLIGSLVALGLVAVLAVSPAYAPPPFDPPGLHRAIAVQELHTDRLLGVPGVVGTAVGLGAYGQPVVKIYTESAGVGGLPRSLDGVPVVVQVTGKLLALHHACGHTGGPPGSSPPDCGDPPVVTITMPADGSIFMNGATIPIDFAGTGSDTEDGDLTAALSWTSSIDGVIGTGGSFSTTLSDGTHTITASVNDSHGNTGSASIGITVGDVAAGTDCFATGSTTERCDRPVPIGVSTGHPNISAGTIGCRVTDGMHVYALSNNHVYADENNAMIDDNVLQPGPFDGGTDPVDAIGTLHDFEPIVFSTLANNAIDAAIALSSTANLGNSTPSDGYGTPKSATVSAALGQAVQKYGRTTSLTKGTVTGINATVNVGYSSGTARFVGQTVVESRKPFLKGGDSGSLLVTDPGRNPVGLMFASNPSGKVAIGNHIDDVLSQFGVTIDGE